MARPLTIRAATPEELDRLHRLLEQPLQPWQRRRLEVALLHAAGHTAQDIAALLGVHVNTAYADLRLSHRRRLDGLLKRGPLGAQPRRVELLLSMKSSGFFLGRGRRGQ
jgi:DNA-binding CsgD family transcriptional regulator